MWPTEVLRGCWVPAQYFLSGQTLQKHITQISNINHPLRKKRFYKLEHCHSKKEGRNKKQNKTGCKSVCCTNRVSLKDSDLAPTQTKKIKFHRLNILPTVLHSDLLLQESQHPSNTFLCSWLLLTLVVKLCNDSQIYGANEPLLLLTTFSGSLFVLFKRLAGFNGRQLKARRLVQWESVEVCSI